MGGCCRAQVCEQIFKPRTARRQLNRYRKTGPDALERKLLARIPAGDLENARVLEIGGGIGIIQAELLTAGAQAGEVVELVSAYEPYARELAREKGIETRSTFRVVDVMETPNAVAPAHIVVLNRVVCCSPDGVRLTREAARHALRTLVLTFPRDRLWVRFVVGVMNGILRLMGRSFRSFVHPKPALYGAAEVEGFKVSTTGTRFVWEFALLRR
jgi:magnesium-protoporphyrin O-methyltransferase